MEMWILDVPCLARNSSFGLVLKSSVFHSWSGEFLAFFDFFKRVTILPLGIRIGGIAPDGRLVSEVSAVVVVADSLIRPHQAHVLMEMWR